MQLSSILYLSEIIKMAHYKQQNLHMKEHH